MLGVDILPAELPREATHHFGDALFPFLDRLAVPPPPGQFVNLPAELAGATIADAGELTPRFKYIEAIREARKRDLHA
jgi:alpha-aminoadipic semialdehyde synthase